MDLSHWLTFFVAAWAISISPGPGAVAAMSAGLNYGFKRGYFTVFGLIMGIWTQLLVVAVGLGTAKALAARTSSMVAPKTEPRAPPARCAAFMMVAASSEAPL